MSKRLVFWLVAVVAAAAVAYAMTVPATLEGEAPAEAVSVEEAPDEAMEAAVTDAPPETARQDTPAVAPQATQPLQPALPTLPAPQSPGAAPDGGQPQLQTQPLGAPTGPLLPAPTAPSSPAAPSAPAGTQDVAVGAVPTSGLPFDAGCGLTLRASGEDRTVFVSGVSLEPIGGPAAVQLDGEVVVLRRAAVDGEPLGFNQFSRQLFQDSGERINVLVEISLAEDSLGETARVTGGTVVVAVPNRPPVQIEVTGRAGC